MKQNNLLLNLLLISFLFISNLNAVNINGKVDDSATNLGIAQAKIVAFKINNHFNDSLNFTYTNDLGEYELNLTETGLYHFYVSHPDYKHGQFGPYNIEVDTTINFVLNPRPDPNLLWITGFVLNQFTNFPIRNAAVELRLLDGTVIQSGISNHRGKYFFKNVEMGDYLLYANAEGYTENIDTISVSNAAFTNHYNIYLTPENGTGAASLSGLVFYFSDDSSETPIPGAVVSLNHHLLGLNFETTADENGVYEFTEIPAGRYFLYAEAEGFGFAFDPPINIEPGANTHDVIMYKIPAPQFGGIKGRVLFDNSNEPVGGVRINFIPTEGGPNFFAQPTAITDSLGYYEYQLPAWDYYVMLEYYAHPAMLNPYIEFYDDVRNFHDATPVTVSDNQTTEGINFGIPMPVSNTVTVTGIVKDNAEAPLNEALVKLIFRGHNAGHYYHNLYTHTNQNGEYSITIENVNSFNNKFIVMANKQGYKKEFYDNQPSIFLADVITVNTNNDTTITDIDFSLEPRTTQDRYSINGRVSDSSGAGLSGTFVAAFGHGHWNFGFNFTDSEGNYSISNLKPGKYYVLFFKLGYAPQFYDGALLWEDATPIELQADVNGIDAILDPLSFGNHPGIVSGNITADSNSPISGVMVSILNQNDNVITYAMTDADGNYNLEGIGTGNYKIYASKVNYQSQSKNLPFDLSNGNTAVVNFNLPAGVTDFEDNITEVPTEYSLSNNYPNPFNPTTKIKFSIPLTEALNVSTGPVLLKVYDILGNEIATLVNEQKPPGNYEVEFNAAGLTSGIYFYKLTSGNFIQTKKMTLIK